MIGTKLAHYEITSHLGTGGMGEVYQATDSKLRRSVAIKLLPAAFASDPDRLSRFRREAQLLASLNHPNIAHIYGLEESGDTRCIVMELIEGETLQARIKKGPIPVDEALAIAKQILEALEAAHEKGVIHRDLKPGNVMLTSDGRAKVLDFGLAKAYAANSANATLSNSPTMASMAATNAGVILGTAAYMSPEQAKGKEVDRRTDIFAFGAVLYEMLTGYPAFGGEDIAEILVAVLKLDPDWNRLSENVRPRVREMLKVCLQKDVKKRRQTATDVRIDMEHALAEPVAPIAAAVPARRGQLGWVVAGVLAIVVAAIVVWSQWHVAPVDRQLVRLSVDLGPEAVRGSGVSVILSPDGTRIAFVGRAEGGLSQLYTRRLDQAGATRLAGTDAIVHLPFFSPNGQWIGFLQSGKIKKVSVDGGSPVILGDAPNTTALTGFGGSWGEDNNIILGSVNGLLRMPASGGIAQPLKNWAASEAPTQLYPHVLPGAKAVLFNSLPQAAERMDNSDIEVWRLDTNQSKMLIHGGYWPQYLPTSAETGHLVFMRDGTLFGVGFDPRNLELLGTPVPLVDNVAANGAMGQDGGGQFAFSASGTLVYLSGHVENSTYPLLWLDSAGKSTPLVGQPGLYSSPRLSPDGKRLAYIAASTKGSDVWVYDFDRGSPTQVTFLGVVNRELVWAKDSKHLVYTADNALWWIRADGSGQRQPLLEKMLNPRPSSFSPDGLLAFSVNSRSLPDIWTMPIDLTDPEHPRPGQAKAFLEEPTIVEVDPAFSPDGKFIAYSSSESGGAEVFVRPFPGPGGKWRVSMAGGKFPAWSAATHELLFLGSDDRIASATYSIQGDVFSAGTPHVWSPTPVLRTGVLQNFDVSPDGKRVAILQRPVAEVSAGSLHAIFLLNFFDDLRRRVPLAK
jgi:serine/threonine-protein kinase